MNRIGPEIKHILCGVDGSTPACRAAENASWLAAKTEASLTFVSVAREGNSTKALDVYRQSEGLGGEPVPVMPSDAETCLAMAQASASALGIPDVKQIVRIGSVAPILVSVAVEVGADTIFLGRYGPGDLRRSLLGSVSRSIAAKSELTLIQVW